MDCSECPVVKRQVKITRIYRDEIFALQRDIKKTEERLLVLLSQMSEGSVKAAVEAELAESRCGSPMEIWPKGGR